MKKVIFIGNCQCAGIREILQRYTNFNTKYIWTEYANWQMIENNEAPPSRDLSEADIVIYQPLSDVYGCYSTNPNNPNNMLKICKENAITISFPRIHNNSLWPIFKKRNVRNDYYGVDFLKYYENQHIQTRKEFLYLYDNHLFDFRMKERFQSNMNITLNKEEETDVKVYNFIMQNYKTKHLFLTHDHPTTCVFHHCASQIIDRLDIEYLSDFDINTVHYNISNSQDSVYNDVSCMYPDSSYSISYRYGIINDDFYKIELQNFLDTVNIF